MKYVATERDEPADTTECSIIEEEEEREIPVDPPTSAEELNSALKDINVAGPSMAPSNVPSAMNCMMPSSSRVVP